LLFFAGPGKIPIAPLNLYHGLRQVKMDLDQLVKMAAGASHSTMTVSQSFCSALTR
jgi:hypothetical protein